MTRVYSKELTAVPKDTILGFGEYILTVMKGDQLIRCIHYFHSSGNDMMDTAYDYRRQYSKEDGFVVDW
tara:strand:- start:2470 stop:2676 length:207 start_codon:yes stop_codon:yes gene_type:complete